MSTFNWTSPVRQGGLGPIPNEVYMEIFKYLRPPDSDPWVNPVYRRDFLSVALVCRFFCSVMLPWIFESIQFTDDASNGLPSLNYAPFCRSIIGGCGLARTMATHVKRCLFSKWMLEPDCLPLSWYDTEFQRLYWRALAFMLNVSEVKLEKTYIDKHILKTIRGLKYLTNLSLEFCSIRSEKGTLNKDIRKLSTLRLKHLRLIGNIDDTRLISQSLCLDSLLTVHTNCWYLVTRISEQNCHLPLRELGIVEALNVELLPKVFRKTPALKKLKITWFSDDIPQDRFQFDDVLPVLEDLCCPLFLLQSLVPGRPISSMSIPTPQLTEITDFQSLFKKSTCRIRSLCVPVYVHRMIPFWEHFSDLESLRLQLFTRQQRLLTERSLVKHLSDFNGNWPRHSRIQELHLDLSSRWADSSFDLELQNRLISKTFSPRFPHLRCMSMSEHVLWNKVQEDDVWKPALHRVPLLEVARELLRGEASPVDYDGFFEQILSTVAEF